MVVPPWNSDWDLVAITSSPRCYYLDIQENANLILDITCSLHRCKNWTRGRISKSVSQSNWMSTDLKFRNSKIPWVLKCHSFPNSENHLRGWQPIKLLSQSSSPFCRTGRKRKTALRQHQQHNSFDEEHVIGPSHSQKKGFGWHFVAGDNMYATVTTTSRRVVKNYLNQQINHETGLIRATTLSLSLSAQDYGVRLT